MFDVKTFLEVLKDQARLLPYLLPTVLLLAAAIVGLRRTRHWSFGAMLCGVILSLAGAVAFRAPRAIYRMGMLSSHGSFSRWEIYRYVSLITTGILFLGAVTSVVGVFGLMASRMLSQAAGQGGGRHVLR